MALVFLNKFGRDAISNIKSTFTKTQKQIAFNILKSSIGRNMCNIPLGVEDYKTLQNDFKRFKECNGLLHSLVDASTTQDPFCISKELFNELETHYVALKTFISTYKKYYHVLKDVNEDTFNQELPNECSKRLTQVDKPHIKLVRDFMMSDMFGDNAVAKNIMNSKCSKDPLTSPPTSIPTMHRAHDMVRALK